jgi:hypothetical protein
MDAPLARQGCAQSREAGLAQPKIGRGAGQSPAVSTRREALDSLAEFPEPNKSSLEVLDPSQTALLLEFFTLLDRWDREAHGN